MTILIDMPTYYPANPRRGVRAGKWSHMVSTVSDEELLEFAVHKPGLKARWLQGEPEHSPSHFDITEAKAILAQGLGAELVSSRELIERHWCRARCRFVIVHWPLIPGAIERFMGQWPLLPKHTEIPALRRSFSVNDSSECIVRIREDGVLWRSTGKGWER